MTSPSDRDPLERLGEEFIERWRRGERPSVEEYAAAHPELADGIRSLFPGMLEMEGLRGSGHATRLAGAEDAGDAAARPPGLPQSIGPYRVEREIGRGGMGVVYLAEDTRLHRRVALKVLPPEVASSRDLRRRFEREASVASRLDHPGICTVYEAGEEQGTGFIAMRYVEGESLDRWVARRSERLRDTMGDVRTREGVLRVVAVIEEAARALHAAHEAGLIHRDIKPANVMVTEAGEPVLLDFGLARETEEAGPALTLSGALMGTPLYMSPEQIAAERGRVDRRTDVYSLGVTLYECLTGRPPFEAPTREALYRRILETEAEDPRRLNRSLPDDLRVVVETAMEKDRERRYRTAEAFAEDLRRVREREPILARPAGPWLRLRRWSERNPAVAGSVAALFLSLSAGLAVSLHLLDETRTERDAKDTALGERGRALEERGEALEAARRDRSAAEEARGRAEEARGAAEVARGRAVADRDAKEEALREARGLGLVAASAAAEARDPLVAAILAREAVRVRPSPDAAGRLASALLASRERLLLEGHGSGVIGVDFDPAGERILTTSSDGTARIWGPDGTVIAVLEGHELSVSRGSFSPDGRLVLTAGEDGTVRTWTADGTPVATTDLRGRVVCAEFSPSGDRIAAVTADGPVRILPRGNGDPISLETPGRHIAFIAWSGTGERLLLGTTTGRSSQDAAGARVWSVIDGSVRDIGVGSGVVRAGRFGAGDRTLQLLHAPGDREPYALIELDVSGEERRRTTLPHAGGIACPVPGSDDWLLGETGEGWRIGTGAGAIVQVVGEVSRLGMGGTRLDKFMTPGDTPLSLAASRDGARVAVGCLSGRVWVFDVQHHLGTVLRGEGSTGVDGVLSRTGRFAATRVAGRFLGAVESRSRTPGEIRAREEARKVRLWDDSGRPLAVLESSAAHVEQWGFSPDESLVLTRSGGAFDRNARLWNLRGELLAVLSDRAGGQPAVWDGAEFAPDSKGVVTYATARVTGGPLVCLWDIAGGLVARLEMKSDEGLGRGRGLLLPPMIEFASDGSRLLVGGDRALRIIDRTGALLGRAATTEGTTIRSAFWEGGSEAAYVDSESVVHVLDERGSETRSYPRARKEESGALATDGREIDGAAVQEEILAAYRGRRKSLASGGEWVFVGGEGVRGRIEPATLDGLVAIADARPGFDTRVDVLDAVASRLLPSEARRRIDAVRKGRAAAADAIVAEDAVAVVEADGSLDGPARDIAKRAARVAAAEPGAACERAWRVLTDPARTGGQVTAAIRWLDAALRRDGTNAKSWATLGLARLRAGDAEGALRAVERAERIWAATRVATRAPPRAGQHRSGASAVTEAVTALAQRDLGRRDEASISRRRMDALIGPGMWPALTAQESALVEEVRREIAE